MSEPAFKQTLRDDGVLLVTLDVPGEKINTLSRSMAEEMDALLTDIETRDEVRAVVMASGKDDYIAGADINDFVKVKSAREGEELSRSGQALLDRLAAARVPVVAAIRGVCLGGGLEVVLACRYRVAADHPSTRLGLPEVTLGLLPGAAGTRRLPRLIGLAPALDMILTGRRLRATRAARVGLVDEVVPPAVLLAASCKAALELADGTRKARRQRWRWADRIARPVIIRKAMAEVEKKTGGHYPAPLRALEVIDKGMRLSHEAALKLEARAFGELTVTEASRSLVSLFFATQEIKKDAGYPADTSAGTVAKLGVLGAGLMGAGVAGAAIEKGLPVRLKDATPEGLGRGLRHIRELLDGRLKRRHLTRREVTKRMDRVSPTLDYSGFSRADVVVEAVFEELKLKRRVLAETEAVIRQDCVFATNTSSIPITDIAKEARHKQRVIGMHFFSPVHRMPLVEVITTEDTDAVTTATTVELGRRLGKHVIVVRDGPGFFTTRVLAPLMNEAARLLDEGSKIDAVDAALRGFGFPMGPFALLDEVGIDVGAKVVGILQASFGERFAPPSALAQALNEGRLGRKNGRGFYKYVKGERKGVDRSIYALIPESGRVTLETREMQDRLVFAFLAESIRCLQEEILRSPRDGDVGAVLGLGFPPFLGGPFRYADALGPRYVLDVLERLRGRHGERFAPPRLLEEKAKTGGTFHP